MSRHQTHTALDRELAQAIHESVAAENESEKVAKRLVTWLGRISEGRTSLSESNVEFVQFFENIRGVLSEEDES